MGEWGHVEFRSSYHRLASSDAAEFNMSPFAAVGNAYVWIDDDDKAAFKADSEAICALVLHDLGPRLACV